MCGKHRKITPAKIQILQDDVRGSRGPVFRSVFIKLGIRHEISKYVKLSQLKHTAKYDLV